MQDAIDQLVQSFFNKKTLQDCSIDELQSLAEHYPYFNVAQFLLTKKLKEENWEAYTKNARKTAIYFENPFWLDFILNQKKNSGKEEKPINFSGSSESKSIIAEENMTDSDTLAKEEEIKIAPLKTEPLPDTNTPLVFEPLHTVDYFASQGIALKEEERPADKFGRQLRSFTEWLKTMKKLPAAEIAKETDIISEKKVVTLAEHSLENRTVMTETMAEVWIKQGHPEKAIEVYYKLSLLEPGKSAYFAGLIEKLKGI
jgi:hypothetical protein